MDRIRLEVIGHFVPGWKAVGIRRERHPGETIQARRCEQTQGIPAPPPAVTDALIGVKDDEVEAALRQMVADRESSLTAANHNNLSAGHRSRSSHVCGYAP
jgi:hypothetical protein